MKKADPSGRDVAQEHASFLRAILALDGSDPNLPRFVPPPAAESVPEAPPPPQH